MLKFITIRAMVIKQGIHALAVGTLIIGFTFPANVAAALTLGFTSKPAPALPGAFCVCSVTVREPGLYFDKNHGIFYFPRKRDANDRRQCVVDHRSCNEIRGGPYHLAVIHHAIGISEAEYDEFSTHLATHGFAVMSMSTNSNTALAGNGLAYLYSEIGGSLTDNIALIGHSRGGDLVLSEGQYVSKAPVNKNLAAMVLMAPRIYSDETFDLNGITPALLGLHWARDNDQATYGGLGPPRRSIFKAYDNAGIVKNDANSLSLTKDFVFFDLAGHAQQNNPGIIAYTTAFLHRHLASRKIYDRFLKHQEMPVGLAVSDLPLSQQHADPDRLVVANFEPGALKPSLFTNAFELGIGTLISPFDWSWELDYFSPHDTQVLKFRVYSPSTDSAVELPLSSPQSLYGYRYFSFRITQVYDDVDMPSGDNRSFDVQLCSEDTCWSADLATYGGVPFPQVTLNLPLTQGGFDSDATKNAMRSILIPLVDFGLPYGTLIDNVRLDFSDGNAEGAQFIVDDLEFYH